MITRTHPAGTIRLALPHKGRLSERALALLESAGLRAGYRADRSLMATLGDDFQALFVRAADVPEFVADGAADLGVTGADLVEESGRRVTELLDLGFGVCRLVAAVPEDAPIRALSEIPAGTRVATSFPRITAGFFRGMGISVEIAPVSGAAEIAPKLGVADVVVDLTSTGSTLRVHHLREVGTLLESSARLIANPDALERDEGVARSAAELATALDSVLRAQRKRYLMANVPRARLREVREVLPGLSGPTVVEVLDGGGWVAAHAVVDEAALYPTISRLKALGAEGILVTRIERLTP